MERTAGEELKRYRVNALFTQKRLGEMLGKRGKNAVNTIQKWEAGKSPISPDHMIRLHELLHIPYEAMLPHTHYQDGNSPAPE